MTIILTLFWFLRGMSEGNGNVAVLATVGEFLAGITISLAVMVKLRGRQA